MLTGGEGPISQMLYGWSVCACLGLVDVKVRIGDAEEGVRGSDPHEGDVVVLEDIPGVHVSLVAPDKVVQLVVEDDAVRAPAHQAHHLCRVLILLGLEALLPAAVLDGVAKEQVQEQVDACDDSTERAHDPIEYAHVNLHELALNEARIAIHY